MFENGENGKKSPKNAKLWIKIDLARDIDSTILKADLDSP